MSSIDKANDKSFFPFGTHYYCFPTPLPEDWEYDFKEISNAGYTHVQYRTVWRYHERLKGTFVWNDLDKLFDLAEKYKLRVILKPMLENAPDWVFTELDGTRIGFYGVPITRFAMNSAYYAGGFMPCFDNPQVIDASVGFLKKLTKRFCNHPALWCYDAWNEPRSRPMAQCCCEHSVASYREWLKDNFGTIDELNEKFHKVWTDYESVIPPISNRDLVEMYLWRQWATYAVAKQIEFVNDAIRSVNPDGFVMVHVGSCSVCRDPACDSSDDLLNARAFDRYGFSQNLSYAPTSLLDHNEAEFQSSWLRRVDPSYWCHEFYPHGPQWRRPTEPKILHRHIWMSLAGGCNSFTFWEYRNVRMGIMSKGFGIRNVDGTPTQTSEICEENAKIIKKYGQKLIQTSRKPSEIALLHCTKSDLLHRLLIMDSWMNNIQNVKPDVDYCYKEAIRAVHLLYNCNGEAVDFVVPGDDLSNIRILHITCKELIDQATADWLREFVQNGGTLIIEHPFASRDERTWLTMQRPAYGLADLLGCTEEDRIALTDDDNEWVDFTNGIRLKTNQWRVDLGSGDGDPIAYWSDKKVAAVVNTYGKGKVYTFGINPALSFNGEVNDPVFGLYEWLLIDSGLRTKDELQQTDQQLWIRERYADNFSVRFIFNVSEESKKTVLPVKPLNIWQSIDTEADTETEFTIKAGGTLVVELPLY